MLLALHLVPGDPVHSHTCVEAGATSEQYVSISVVSWLPCEHLLEPHGAPPASPDDESPLGCTKQSFRPP